MADANTLPIEFSIVGFEQMQRDFAALSSRVDDMAGSVSKNSKAMTTGFKDVAANAKRSIASTTANLRSLLPVLGGTQAQFVMMASNVGEQFEKLATATGATAAMIKGGIVIATAAAAFEFGKWAAEAIGLNKELERSIQLGGRYMAMSAGLKKSYSDITSAEKGLQDAIDLATVHQDVYQDGTSALKVQLDAIPPVLDRYQEHIEALTKSISDNEVAIRQQQAIYEKIRGTVAGAGAEQQAAIATLKKANEDNSRSIKVATERYNELLATLRRLQGITAAGDIGPQLPEAKGKTESPAVKNVVDYEISAADQVRLMSMAIGDEMANAYAYVERYNIPALVSEQIQQTDAQFRNWVASMQVNIADVQMFIMDTFSAATQGIGNAIAQAVVYGENLGKLFEELGKQILASVISTLLQLLMQELMYLVLGSFIMAADLTAKISAMAAFAAAAAYAWAVASMGLIGMAVGPGLAVEAAAMTTAAGAYGAGIGAAAGPGIAGIGQAGGLLAFGEGAYVRSPVMALVGDAPGGEIVAPRSDYEAMIATARQPSVGHVYLDGRELTQSVVKWIPGEVRRKGVKGI